MTETAINHGTNCSNPIFPLDISYTLYPSPITQVIINNAINILVIN